jgi:hypothetical protein
MATETIQYKVLHKKDAIEIREYGDILLASTKTDPNNYYDSGFNRVFQYISGQNEANQKISMTSPVVTYQEGESLVTGFYVPSQYDHNTVPKPTGDVYINNIEPSIYVVVTFYGAWTKENYDRYHKELLEYIQSHQYQVRTNPFIMRYNAPYIPDHMKRNEIAYQITNFTP